MELQEAKLALISGAPVECKGIIYKEISAIIYRAGAKSGDYKVRLELADKCGHSCTVARLDQVKLSDKWAGSLSDELPPTYEDGPSIMELNVKEAIKTGCPVIYKHDRWRVTAMKVCDWTSHDYWLFVELTRISDRRVTEAWAGSLIMERSQEDRAKTENRCLAF